MNAAKPEIGAWYQTLEGGYLEVVAFDADADCIEIQFYDGNVEEYDGDSWEELALRRAEPPEDWSGSMDMTREDYGVDLDAPAGGHPGHPLDLIDEQDNKLD